MLSDIEKAYIAGIIDGEGCIYIDKFQDNKRKKPNPNYVLRITVSMTDETVPLFLKHKIGGSFYTFSRPKFKTAFIWRVTSRKAIEFLVDILPFLKVKYRQALVGIEFSKTLYPVGRLARNGQFVRFPEGVLHNRELLKIKIQELNQNKKGGRKNVVLY